MPNGDAQQQPSAEVEKRKPIPIQAQWKSFVTTNLKAIESAMPRIGITPESVARTALSQMYRNQQLMACDRLSVMRAIVEAASLGLTFALGRAYLVPFNNKVKGRDGGADTWRLEAQLIPGYMGLVDLVRRSAGVKSVLANAVYNGDDFAYSAGLTEDTFSHVSKVEPDPSALTHAYCIIRFLDGGYQWVVLTRKQIDSVRARSKAGDFGPWKTDYAAMAIKTAVRRCTKLCPASIELVRALELDDRHEMGEPQELATDIVLVGGENGNEEPHEIAEEEPTTATERVKDRLKKKKAAEGKSEAPDLSTEIADIASRLLAHAGGSKSRADVELSSATNGRFQKFEDLEAVLTANYDVIAQIDDYLKAQAP